MNNLVQRSLTGILIVLFTVFSVVWGEISFMLFYLIVLIFCVIEYHSIIRKIHGHPILAWELVISVVLFVLSWLAFKNTVSIDKFIFLIPLMTFVLVTELYRHKKRIIQNVASTFLPVIHIALPFSLFIGLGYLGGVDYNYRPALAVILFTWTFDTFAFLFGVWIGQHKLAPKISPKKSWEGFVGGLISGVGLAFVLAELWPLYTPVQWVVISLIVSVGATLGDLVESMMKRAAHVKDSGSILPGHGGVLDRFDGFVLVTPLVFTYLHLLKF